MKKVIPLLILFTSFFPKTLLASHAMGADITYRCLGSDQYEITYTFYRDCAGIPAPPTMSMTITDSIGGASQFVTLNPTPSSPTFIHTVCPSATTTCLGGTFTGIQKWVYQGVISLPGPSTSWIIYHSENARNAAITTITGAGGDDLFVYAVINNTNGLCNNSPTFSSDPVPIVCLGNPFCFDQGTFDLEGDSLTYQFITPRNGPLISDTVQYLAGYSASQAIISNPLVTINSSTGQICMTPQQPEVSVMAVLVNEYRQGVLIGQIERDIQIIVLACNNNLPVLAGINGLPANYQINVCATLQNCFFITAYDPDTTNSTFITWDASVAAMTATHTFGQRDTLFFCWTPSDSDTITNSNCFTAIVSDDNCPYFGIQSKTYCLIVQPSYICNPNSVSSLSNTEFDVKIFPQPARDFITVKFGKPFNGNLFLVLHNILGESVFRTLINDQNTMVNLKGILKDGIYFARISDADGNTLFNHKLIFIN